MTEKKSKKEKKKKNDAEAEVDETGKDTGTGEDKTIIVGAKDIETLVIHSVSDLLDKGVLAESEDGTKIDLKENVDYEKDRMVREEESEGGREKESKRGKGKKKRD